MVTLWLLGAAVALGAAAWWFGRAQGRRSRVESAFLASSVTTRAEVVDIREHTTPTPTARRVSDPMNTFDTVDYFPVVRFSLPDGGRSTAMTMRGSHPAPARVGDVVEVRYDPADPTRVVLAHGLATIQAGSCMSLALVVGLSVMSALCVLLWVLLKVLLRVPG